ncbi:MAG: hypothetical protein H6Q19_258 [Bacteroidetes bacterium]|nr:hypothetical protein [Bacteroidota bacterium]
MPIDYDLSSLIFSLLNPQALTDFENLSGLINDADIQRVSL